MLSDAMTLWKQYKDEGKFKYWEVCCDREAMKNTFTTVQAHNIGKVSDFSFLIEFVHSPYALSMSFLKDPSILGKQDDFGQLKYKLNLDEELLEKFFEIIRECEAEN